jgi:hypothetical protein
MLSLFNLIALLLTGLAALYWWQSGLFKGRAREFAIAHCRQLGLQLLDQSMVITGLWPARSEAGQVVFRRTYEFEFSSIGDQRYRGRLILIGMRLLAIDLEAYKVLPPDE